MAKLFVVGFGPGNAGNMTAACHQALEQAEIIVGYTGYVDLIRPLYPQKSYLDTPMMGEVARCRLALEKAEQGFTVAVICSGDSGIYGMATLIYELYEESRQQAKEDLSHKSNDQMEVKADFSTDADAPAEQFSIVVIPGITAAASGGALLGAPLAHDFVTLSLSDLLTPWELIAKRLKAAALGDFVICLYNPGSKKRHDYLRLACEILLEYKSPDTVCGYVQNIGRSGENAQITTLKDLAATKVDMFTTVFIGNSMTQNLSGKMVTPRGYNYG